MRQDSKFIPNQSGALTARLPITLAASAQFDKDDNVIAQLLQMPLSELAQLPIQKFLDSFAAQLQSLNESAHPFASRCMQLARLMALHRNENEPDGSFERPFKLHSQRLQEQDPLNDSEIHPLKVFDLGVKSKFLRSSQQALLRAICQVQQRCAIPIEKVINPDACTGLFFAHTIKELREVLSVDGAQVATLEDGQGTVWGTYLAHTGEIAEEDQLLVERALQYLDAFCIARKLDPSQLPELPHVGHLICIDLSIREFKDESGRSYSRRTLYGDLHAPIVWESWRSARRRGLHSSLMVGTCRPDNPALKVHQQFGWVDLTSEFGAPPIEKWVELPGGRGRRKYELHILALSTADPLQDQFIKRDFPDDTPIMRRVPFVDLDPSNGVDLPEIAPQP